MSSFRIEATSAINEVNADVTALVNAIPDPYGITIAIIYSPQGGLGSDEAKDA